MKTVGWLLMLLIIAATGCTIRSSEYYGPPVGPPLVSFGVHYGEYYVSPPPFVPTGYAYRRWCYERSGEYVNVVFIDGHGRRHREHWRVNGRRMRHVDAERWHKQHRFNPRNDRRPERERQQRAPERFRYTAPPAEPAQRHFPANSKAQPTNTGGQAPSNAGKRFDSRRLRLPDPENDKDQTLKPMGSRVPAANNDARR